MRNLKKPGRGAKFPYIPEDDRNGESAEIDGVSDEENPKRDEAVYFLIGH